MKITEEQIEIVIGLLESTLGDMPAKEADEIVDMCIHLLKREKPQKNNKAKAKYYICKLANIKWS